MDPEMSHLLVWGLTAAGAGLLAIVCVIVLEVGETRSDER